jgi:hypothetical protein
MNPTPLILALALALSLTASAADTYHNYTGSGTNIVHQTMTPVKGGPPVFGERASLNASQRQALRNLWNAPSLDLPREPIFTCIRETNGVVLNLNFRLGAKEARFIFAPTEQEKTAAAAALP